MGDRFDLTDEDRENLDGCRVVASISGGKDSAALSLWLTEQGIEHDRLFADTGWEHPATYEYLRGPLTEKLGTITEVRSHLGGMADVVRKRMMFPGRLRRFCTQEFKIRPIARWCKKSDVELVNAIGVRAAESRARAGLPRWDVAAGFDSELWRPLIDWTEQDVIKMHQRHGLAPNPLYLRGAARVGCWPCIFSRKREIALVAKLSPERIDLIRQLEQEIGDGAEARMAADGKFRNRPTFFHPRGLNSDCNDFVPIDEVVEWARTAHGGRQMLLLDTEPAGCVRWGMCEGHPEADDNA